MRVWLGLFGTLNGCPTFATFLFLSLRWDSTTPTRAVRQSPTRLPEKCKSAGNLFGFRAVKENSACTHQSRGFFVQESQALPFHRSRAAFKAPFRRSYAPFHSCFSALGSPAHPYPPKTPKPPPPKRRPQPLPRDAAIDLPVRKVVLYKNGVGYSSTPARSAATSA